MLTGEKPNVKYLRTFCCRVWISIHEAKCKKLEPKAQAGVLMYCISHGKYKACNEIDGRMKICRQCQISEKEFPERNWNSKKVQSSTEDAYWSDNEDDNTYDKEWKPSTDSQNQYNSDNDSEYSPSVVDSDYHSSQEEKLI